MVLNVNGIALNTFGLEARGFANALSLLTRGLVYQSWFNSYNEFVSGTSWASSEGSISTTWSDADASITTTWTDYDTH